MVPHSRSWDSGWLESAEGQTRPQPLDLRQGACVCNGPPRDECQSAWPRRGDFGADEWQRALTQVQVVREKHPIDYLLGTPLLPDRLNEGPAPFG